jgi:hypothetical protein
VTKNTLPANLPDVPDAKLPATYEAAQKALAECTRVDEAWDWANKAAALAAYARMARDTALRDMTLRIQARAIRRAGELLRMIEPAHGANQNIQDGGVPKVTRESAATDAGLSERQRRTALRTANVPVDEFEKALASDNLPTITELAARGAASRPIQPSPAVVPADPAQVAKATALLREFAAFCGATDPARIACSPVVDADLARGYVSTIDSWLDRFVTRLPSEEAA